MKSLIATKLPNHQPPFTQSMIATRQASVCLRCVHRIHSSQLTLGSHSLRNVSVSPPQPSTALLSKPQYLHRTFSSALPSKPQRSKRTSIKKKKQVQEASAELQIQHGPLVHIFDYTHSKEPPGKELDQLQVLVNELLETNSPVAKRAILARYPDQAPLLSWIYDPQKQFHVRPSSIVKYIQLRARQQDEAAEILKGINPQEGLPSIASTAVSSFQHHPDLSENQIASAKARAAKLGQGFDTLASLLSALSTRAITGHSALDAILMFMIRFCSDPIPSFSSSNSKPASTTTAQQLTKELLATPRSKLMLKILDKNLKTGCSAGLIRGVYPDLIPEFNVALAHNLLHMEDAQKFFTAPVNKPKKVKKKKGEVEDANVEGCEKDIVAWFGSRKLDGVRCLIRIDRATGATEALSRTGREFESLSEVQEAIRTLVGKDEFARNEFFRKAFMRHLGNDKASIHKNDAENLPKAMFLDGEICVFSDQGSTSSSGQDSASDDLGDELGRENFIKAVSLVRRGMGASEDGEVETKYGTGAAQVGVEQGEGAVQSSLSENERMVYCIFDCLADQEFMERKGIRTFSDRLHGLLDALPRKFMDARSSGTDVVHARQWVRVLNQTKLKSFEHLEKLVGLGLEHGWEGVMLRKDVAYEGKRR